MRSRKVLLSAASTVLTVSVLAIAQSGSPGSQSVAASPPPSSGQVRASSELKWLREESVAVTNDRAPRRTDTIPSNVTVITAEQIARSGAKHVPDLLRYYAGIQVTDFFDNGRQARVDLRGFGINADSSTLVLVDGRRINGVTLYNTDWTTIPLERIARIEIVPGGNSVLYGNQAIGAVINIITKRGTVEKEVIGGVDAESTGHVKPYANYSGTHLLFDGVLTYNVSASYTNSNGYRDNENLRMATGGVAFNYEKRNFFMDLTGASKDDRYGLPGGLAPTAPRQTSNQMSDAADTTDSYVHFVPGYRLGENHRILVAVDYRPTNQFSHFSWGSIKDGVAQHGVSPQYVGEHRFGRLKNSLASGFDYLQSDLTRQTVYTGSGASLEGDTLTSKAWYVHDVVSAHEDTVYFDLGYRKERFHYRLRQVDVSRNIDVYAVRFGATWNYRPESKAFASYDRSYRVQLLDELGPFGQEILRPQVARQYQLGIAHRLTSKSDLHVAYFWINTRDEILYDPNKGMWGENTNHPDTRRQGLDAELKAQIHQRVSGFVAYTYLDATTLQGPYRGKRFPLSAPHRGSAGITVSPAHGWWVSTNYRGISGRILDGDFFNVAPGKNGWNVADVVATHDMKKWSITVALRNIFGAHYAEYGYFYQPFTSVTLWPNQSRSVFVAITFHHVF